MQLWSPYKFTAAQLTCLIGMGREFDIVCHKLWPSQLSEIALMLWPNSDVIIGAMASQIIGVSIVFSTVCSGADQRKLQSSASLAFVRGIHRWPVNSPHKGLITRKMFPFDDVMMFSAVYWRNGLFNPLRPEQNGRHFSDDICFLHLLFWYKFHCSLFARIQLTTNQRWFG